MSRQKAALVNEFIKKIKGLTNDLAEKAPGDAQVGRVQRLLVLGADINPIEIVNKVGAKLAHYNASIYSDNPRGLETVLRRTSRHRGV